MIRYKTRKTSPLDLTFRAKITALSLAATVTGLTLALIFFLLQDWLADRAHFAREREGLAQTVAAQSALALKAGDPRLAQDAVDLLRRTEDLQSATFYSIDGRTFVHWGRPQPSGSGLEMVSLSRAISAYRGRVLEVHAPVNNGFERVGELVMVSGHRQIERNLGRNVLVSLGLFALCTAVAGFLALWLSGRVLAPMKRLAAGMEQVRSTKDFSMILESTGSDEFGWLTDRFNALLTELHANDLALRKALDDLTDARDSADAANIMKSQFLANMSHEIRTPLNGVLGMAQVMAINSLSRAQRERLEVVQRSGESLLAILNDLLDLSKIEAGKLDLEEAEFDLAELASGAHAAFTSIAQAKGLSFNLEIGEQARGVWRGDSVRVRQVLYNLISNALKFTTQGEVRVSLDGAEHEGRRALSLEVRDTGIGIPAEKLETLFDKFVQADSSTTRRFGGTGLGLSICRQLVELMGGSIEVRSVEGAGTTFDVVLPIVWVCAERSLPSPPPPEAMEAAPSGVEGRPLKILAAEDNPTNQLVLKTVLHSLGLEPVVVENGRDAIAQWRDGDFDLILMDIQMPVLDGVAAAREIRVLEAKQGRAHTPIVALSANAMKHQVSEYLAAGMDAHLAKPIQLDRFYALLQAFSDGKPLPKSEAA